jgi:hypothetical protein
MPITLSPLNATTAKLFFLHQKNTEAYPSYLLDLSVISASKQGYLTVLGGSSCPKHY